MVHRDLDVFKTVQMEYNIPIAILLGGGNEVRILIIVTESAITGLICTKYTCSFYHIYLFFCMSYTISVSFIEFLRTFCVHDDIYSNVLC